MEAAEREGVVLLESLVHMRPTENDWVLVEPRRPTNLTAPLPFKSPGRPCEASNGAFGAVGESSSPIWEAMMHFHWLVVNNQPNDKRYEEDCERVICPRLRRHLGERFFAKTDDVALAVTKTYVANDKPEGPYMIMYALDKHSLMQFRLKLFKERGKLVLLSESQLSALPNIGDPGA